MHQVRTHGLLAVVKDVYLLNRHVALVNIVELDSISIQQQVAHSNRIIA